MVRILEISRIPLFKCCLPKETTWFSTGAALIIGDEGCASERFTPGRILRLIGELRTGTYDLVVLPAVSLSYAYDAHWKKRLLRRLVGAFAKMGWVVWLLEKLFRWTRNTVVFVDVDDCPSISYAVCQLIPGFLGYFKREFNRNESLRNEARWQSCNRRIFPFSLFLPSGGFTPDASRKKSDVFFAGQMHNKVRVDGMESIRRLEARGYAVDVPENRLAYPEYLQRMAEAWVVWSPEGFGWDCYRHYEAAFAGSVPVINEPLHPRLLPYEEGGECFFYRPEAGNLEQVIAAALEDKERLRAMAAKARARVLACYTRAGVLAGMQAAILEELRRTDRRSRLLDEWSGGGPAEVRSPSSCSHLSGPGAVGSSGSACA